MAIVLRKFIKIQEEKVQQSHPMTIYLLILENYLLRQGIELVLLTYLAYLHFPQDQYLCTSKTFRSLEICMPSYRELTDLIVSFRCRSERLSCRTCSLHSRKVFNLDQSQMDKPARWRPYQEVHPDRAAGQHHGLLGQSLYHHICPSIF